MLDKYLISYNHEESVTHNINPLNKIIIFILYIIACFFPYNSVIIISLLVSVFILMILSNIPLIKYLQVLWFYRYIFLVIYFFFYATGMEFFNLNVLIFKIVFGVLFWYILLFTIKKDDLAKSFGFVFNIFNVIGISFNKISNFFSNIFNFILIFIDQTNNLFEINAIKGNDIYFVTIIGKIKFFFRNFKTIYNNSKVINKNRRDGLKYRLYDAESKKMYKYRSKLNVFDYLLIIVYVFIYVYYIVKVR